MKGADPRVLAGPSNRGVTPGHLLALLAVGLVGLLLDAHGLAAWADGLPESAAPVRDAAHWLDDALAHLGLTAPYDALHRWVGEAVSRGF